MACSPRIPANAGLSPAMALAVAIAGPLPAIAQDFGLGPRIIPGEFVVQTDPTFESTALPALESIGARVMASPAGSQITVIRQPAYESIGLDDAIRRLESLPGVRRVEPAYLYDIDAMPNDPLAERMWMIASMEADKAWGVIDDASEVVVAVIDDAVQADHEDLAANMWVNEGEIPGNGIDDDNNGYVDDVHGFDTGDLDGDPRPDAHCWVDSDDTSHGTHVAGTVGAVGNNGVGVVGMAPKVRIMGLKTTRSPQRAGERCVFAPSGSVIAAIEYAIKNGADVITMSLSGPFRSEIERDLLRDAAARNISLTTSASNNGLDIDPELPYGAVVGRDTGNGEIEIQFGKLAPVFPAAWNLPNQLTVAATQPPGPDGPEFVRAWRDGMDWTHVISGLSRLPSGDVDFSEMTLSAVQPGQMPIGSNYGAERVHIAAPGKDIISTVPKKDGGGLGSGYASFSGTSMSTPAVAGAVAILRAAFPEASAAEIRDRVIATADRSPSLDGRTVAGGEINLYAALCAPGAPRDLPGCDAGREGGNDGGVAAPSAPVFREPRAVTTSSPPASSAPAAAPSAPTSTANQGAVNVNDLLGE